MLYRRVVIHIEQSVFDRAVEALTTDGNVFEAIDTAMKLLFYETDKRKVYVDSVGIMYEK